MVETNDILIFDRALRQKNLRRTAPKIDKHRFLIDWSDTQILERLDDIKRTFPCALHIGGRSDAEKLSLHPSIDTLFTLDALSGVDIIADEECLPLRNQSLDLVTSSLNLHATNDLPGALIQIKNALKPDGLFLATMFGGETLHELRASLMHAEMRLKNGASPRIFPFADKQQTGALLQRAGFALPVIDSELITVTYENIFKLMHDLRFMGEGNIIRNRSRLNPGKAFFMEAAQYYQEHFTTTDRQIIATFEIIFMIGWAPHQSQQKPLKPGSAQNKLAEALRTHEIKTGEKATP